MPQSHAIRAGRDTDHAGAALQEGQSAQVVIRVPLVSPAATAKTQSAGQGSSSEVASATADSKPSWRIDDSHLEVPPPHLLTPLPEHPRGQWLALLLRRRSLLAIGLIVIAAMTSALTLSHQTSQDKVGADKKMRANTARTEVTKTSRARAAKPASGSTPTHPAAEKSSGTPAPTADNALPAKSNPPGTATANHQPASAANGPALVRPSDALYPTPPLSDPTTPPDVWSRRAAANSPARIDASAGFPSAGANDSYQNGPLTPAVNQPPFPPQRGPSSTTSESRSETVGPAAFLEGRIDKPPTQTRR